MESLQHAKKLEEKLMRLNQISEKHLRDLTILLQGRADANVIWLRGSSWKTDL
jgi:hypothetical protein